MSVALEQFNKPEKRNRYYAYYEAPVYRKGLRRKYRNWLKQNVRSWRWSKEKYSNLGYTETTGFVRLVFKRSQDRNLFLVMNPNCGWHATPVKIDETEYFFDSYETSKMMRLMVAFSISLCAFNILNLIHDIIKTSN